MKHTHSPARHKTSLCDAYLKLFHQNGSFRKHYTLCEYKTRMGKKAYPWKVSENAFPLYTANAIYIIYCLLNDTCKDVKVCKIYIL